MSSHLVPNLVPSCVRLYSYPFEQIKVIATNLHMSLSASYNLSTQE